MHAFSDEQIQFRETVRRFLADHSSTKRTRELMDSETGFDAETYRRLIQELGIGGVHLPEEFGGAGLTFVELCLLLEEMGRALYPSPYFASNVLGAEAILLAGSESQKSEWLPRVASGETLATVAVYESANLRDLSLISSTVRDSKFTGTKRFVIDGHVADVFVVVANDHANSASPSFWLASADDNGVAVESTQSIDTTRRIAQVEFDDVKVERLGAVEESDGVFDQFIDRACIALANEMVGGAQWLLESSVDYANERVQFGRPISSMQAIKHKCAHLLLEVEMAKSAAYRAASAVAAHDPQTPEFASIAKAASNVAYMQAATDAIQIHGGIGFTWDNDTHLWFKRAKSSEVLFGTTESHREALLQRMNGTDLA